MRTSNPTLTNATFIDVPSRASGTMTIDGVIAKSAVLMLLALCGAVYTWSLATRQPQQAVGWVVGGALGGFIVALITSFKKDWSAILAPLYAVLEGLFLGGISAMFEVKYHGIAFQAVILTFGTLACLLVAYRARLIRATEKFKLIVFGATGAIGVLYLVGWVLSFFHMSIPFIHQSGWIGIGFSLFVVGIAALNLVLDFDLIETGAAQGAPKYMEWYGAFALLVTLVWLYIEILRLLSKFASRRD